MKYSTFFILLFTYITQPSLGQDSTAQKALDSIHAKTEAEAEHLYNLYQLYADSLKSVKDELAKTELSNKIDSLNTLRQQNHELELELEFEFIQQYPASPLALDIMLSKMRRRVGLGKYDRFKQLYDNLAPELKASNKGQGLLQQLIWCKNSSVGSAAPDFKLKDVNGQSLELHSFKGKNYVLIDFWASWCVPCKDDLPFLKKMYAMYHSRGLEIISISTDEKPRLWKKAIEKEEIYIWKHALDKANGDLVAKHYFISAIPVKILIDKEGKIIGRWRGGGEENSKSLEQILQQSF